MPLFFFTIELSLLVKYWIILTPEFVILSIHSSMNYFFLQQFMYKRNRPDATAHVWRSVSKE